jgi:hypothetical protein
VWIKNKVFRLLRRGLPSLAKKRPEIPQNLSLITTTITVLDFCGFQERFVISLLPGVAQGEYRRKKSVPLAIEHFPANQGLT